MSDGKLSTAGADPTPDTPLTAGAMLKSARECSGLHIAALSASLKVPVAKLVALEADQFDLLPGAVFIRGLASSICRSLKIDAEPILRLLPGHPAALPAADLGAGIGDLRRPRLGGRPAPSVSKPTALTAAALLLCALALWWLPPVERIREVADQWLSALSTASSSRAAPEPAMLGVPSAVVQAPLPPAAAASNPGAPGTVADLLVFTTRESSWIGVTDAAGVVKLSRTMGRGETASAGGAMPLSVTVGRVDSTELLLRGQRVDLTPLSRNNVARLLVKENGIERTD